MISRMQDFACFDERTFLELESKLNKKNKTYNNIVEAKANSNNDSNITKSYNGYTVATKQKMPYQQAMDNKMFKKVAWGEFVYAGYTGRESYIDGKYSFDDGAIWTVVKGEDGKEYLVKNIENDEIVRVASKKVTAVNDDNIHKIGKALNLFDFDKKTYSYLKERKLLANICNDVNKSLTAYIQNYITQHNYIESKEVLDDILNVVGSLSDNIENKNDINDIIESIVSQQAIKVGDYK